MDPSSLRSNAASRRTSTQTIGWKCDYCNKTYKNEKIFLEHQCKGKRRLGEMKTPIGQSAYASYCQWLASKRNTKQSVDTFTASRYYTSFIKFAEYCERLNIDGNAFVNFITLRHKDILPTLWCSDKVYSLYLANFDKIVSPFDQVAETLIYLERQAEILECKQQDILSTLGFRKVLEAFRLKKISPWFLLTSTSGRTFISNLDKEDLSEFERHLDLYTWSNKLSEDKLIVRELEEFLIDK